MIGKFVAATFLTAAFVSYPSYAHAQDTGSSTTSQSDAQPQCKQKNCDVDDIGTRDINKHQMNFYSIQKEMEIGRQLAAEVERQVKLLKDPVIGEYINRVGQNLVKNSDAKVPFTIKVVDSDDINAFALPGGFFYVNTGLIKAADNEAELAAVMGHEIAHVAARHGTENATKADLTNLASIGLIFVGGPAGMAARQSAGFLVPMQFLAFSRANEAEADYLGLQYMYHAGYDPSAFISMFEKLQAFEATRPGTVSPMFRTHPATEDRIKNTKKNIETILAPRDEYVVSTSEFDEVKARLIALENQRPNPAANGGGVNSGRPTMTRKSPSGAPNPSDTGSSSGDDDRPILKRSTDDSGSNPGSDSSTPSSPPSSPSPDDSNTQPTSSDPNAPPILTRKPSPSPLRP